MYCGALDHLPRASVLPIRFPTLGELNNISKTENRATIRLPTDSRQVSRATIIAASEAQVCLLVEYKDDSGISVTVWTGHPLIPSSWKELFSPQPLASNERFAVAASSDGHNMCLGFFLDSDIQAHTRIRFKCYDVIADQWTEMCTIDGVRFERWATTPIAHTSLGWVALTRGINDALLLFKITQGKGVLIKCLPFDMSSEQVLGYHNLYLYSDEQPATLTVYPLDKAKKSEKLAMEFEVGLMDRDEQWTELQESNGQLFCIDVRREGSVVRKVGMEGGVCKLQEELLRSQVPLSAVGSRLATFDSTNIYVVYCTDGEVYLSTLRHQPPSLQSLAMLGIQKMYGVRREFKLNVPRHSKWWLEGVDSVCSVWEGGIRIDEFKDRYGCKGKLF